MTVDHDVQRGLLHRCQITGATDLFEVIDLGHQPPCDSMLTAEQLNAPEVAYPLRLMLSPTSGLAQLDYVLDSATMFRPDYPYRSGVSAPLVAYQRALARSVVERFRLPAGSFCVDVGSNDGTLLKGFADCGMRVLGVEPTNVAWIARSENGVPTVQEFFTENVGRGIAADHGKARVVCATNAFAHMAALGEVCRGIEALLADDGIFVTESHYLLDVLQGNQFDTILHEHIRTYSLRSLVTLFGYYGLEVFDVERGDRYGGNIRAYVGRVGRYPIARAVDELLAIEEAAGLFDPASWAAFRERVNEGRDRFMAFAWRTKAEGRKLLAQSCPGRCIPLLNYYGINAGLLGCIGEVPGSLKIGRYTPGAHIPVVSQARIVDERPDYVLVNAWHYRDAIARSLAEAGLKAELIVALPTLEFLRA